MTVTFLEQSLASMSDKRSLTSRISDCMRSYRSIVARKTIANPNKIDEIALFWFSSQLIALSAHSAQVKAIAPSLLSDKSAIALSVADELAFGVDRKFGCNAIAYSRKIDAIAFFGFSYKAISISSYLAQVKAIAPKKNDMIKTLFS